MWDAGVTVGLATCEVVGIDEERVVAEFTRHALARRDRSI